MNDLIVVEKIAQWQRLKALVLDSVSMPDGYRNDPARLPGDALLLKDPVECCGIPFRQSHSYFPVYFSRTRFRSNLESFGRNAPSKPSELSFDSFVGSLPAESDVMRAFGFQSIHRLLFARFSAVMLIPTPADSLRSGLTDARQKVLIRGIGRGSILHAGEPPPPASPPQVCPGLSNPSGTRPGKRRGLPRLPFAS
jgi:hypothetical protein